MSSKKDSSGAVLTMPIAEFQYRSMVVAPAQTPVPVVVDTAPNAHEILVNEEALRKSIAAERASASAETETRLRLEFEQRQKAESLRISKALSHFEQSRKEYFAKVEIEVVQLALSITAKILHRESQVDPLLVAAIVQVALGQLKEGAAASIRVRPEEAKLWQDHFAAQSLASAITIVEDAELQTRDCILETELGSVNFSLDVQLKEIERGFFDVLAQRPV